MRTFLLVWTGQFISLIGSRFTSFAVGVWLYTETGSATLFSFNTFFILVPTFIFSPIAGVIADRYDRRKIMMLSDAGAAASTLAIALLFWTGNLRAGHILAASFFREMCSTFQYPAYISATTLLVPKERLGNVNGLKQFSASFAYFIVPLVAGTLFVSIGLHNIFIIDLITFSFALLTLTIVRFPKIRPTKTQPGSSSIWFDLKESWLYLKAKTGLLWLIATVAIINLLFGVNMPLFSPMVLDISSPKELGYVSSAQMLGAVLGGIIMGVWGGPKKNRVFMRYVLLAATGLFSFLQAFPSLVLISIGGFFAMLSVSIAGSISHTLFQLKIDPKIQGRIFSLMSAASFSTSAFAAAFAGPLADRVFNPLMTDGGLLSRSLGPVFGVGPSRGIALMFAITSILSVITALLVYLHPRIRYLEYELPDALPDQSPQEQP